MVVGEGAMETEMRGEPAGTKEIICSSNNYEIINSIYDLSLEVTIQYSMVYRSNRL